jgi:hypothetical protein
MPHDSPVFIADSVRSWPVGRPHANFGLFSGLDISDTSPDTSHIPSPPEDFEGREIDMHQVISLVLTRRLVVLLGDLGMGKTSVVCACCQYMEERCFFEDGIKFFRMNFVNDHEDFLRLLDMKIVKGMRGLFLFSDVFVSHNASSYLI